MTAPSTGTTSPFRTTRRSPGSITSKSTSSSRPFRWRTAVCGTRARSAVISRLARRSAKSSRYCPPAYIKATTTAARYSAKTSAASIDSAATISNPMSPRRKLMTISATSASRTGIVAAAHIGPAHCAHPENCAASPMARPAAGQATIIGRRSFRRSATDRDLSSGGDRSDRLSMHLRRLNGPQIKQERTRVFARETKRRHIGMADHQPFAQPLHKRIQIESAIERTKGRGANVRTLTAFADRMTLRAHSFRRSAAALFQWSGAAVFGQARRCCEQQKENCEPHDHFPSSHARRKNRILSPPTALRKIKSRWLNGTVRLPSIEPGARSANAGGSMRVHAGGLEQGLHALARVEHPRLHGVGGRPDNLSDLVHGFFVIVDEIEHFPMERRKLRQAVLNECASIALVNGCFRIVGGICDCRRILIEPLIRTASQRRKRLMARDGQHPRGNLRLHLETLRSAPHVDENLAGDVLGQRAVVGETQDKAVNPHTVPRVKRLHRAPVAGCDGADQSFV